MQDNIQTVKTDNDYSIRVQPKGYSLQPRYFVFLREVNLNHYGFASVEDADLAIKNHKFSGFAITGN